MTPRQIFTALQSRQPQIERFMQALVETESPSGDDAGSRAVVDLLAQAAGGLECVNAIDRVDVPGFGQHIVIRAFQEQKAGLDRGPYGYRSCAWFCERTAMAA